MSGGALLLLLLQAGAPPAEEERTNFGGEYGWICSAPMNVDGYRGGILRHYDSTTRHGPYLVQLHWRSGERRYRASWTIDPRPEGPPPSPPRRRMRYFEPRAERQAFEPGPESVGIDFGWYVAGVVGPVHARYWGDGVYVGEERLYTARQVRRRIDRDGMFSGFSGGLNNPALLRALAAARTWRVVVTDSVGKVLLSESFDVPRREAVAAEFRRARAALDSAEARFRIDHERLIGPDASCQDNEDPEATI